MRSRVLRDDERVQEGDFWTDLGAELGPALWGKTVGFCRTDTLDDTLEPATISRPWELDCITRVGGDRTSEEK
jgi:hypothetical protein